MSSVALLQPKRFGDARGWFAEVYSETTFQGYGITERFVQDNHSLSIVQYTLRGLHFQTEPFAQAKLVRCVRGSIFDVAVDLRSKSPTFGQWVGAELSAENGNQLYIPVGFAHGFLTLEPMTEVVYKVSNVYSPACDCGLKWDDPAVGVIWPLPKGASPILSDKDQRQPPLSEIGDVFEYDGTPMSLVQI
ncbi:dTDP-4-dehydrorhamnose 3,5-epimerase [Ensifer sp. HO-A22]|uniref:dTDP-4-dehydrorhamnose 3,5-epimerase n=1 Tax=Ensifer oleiphilus TaxID=2742698 RepID=A0A7Y6Q663_9HYPH|nr:dTDP-4-dehydrorhamnose 3,5-epimerase [Ensifer oleiphilus]NVD39793.1 dTDP-4-dehydrorhamnose 3,5-epimerase [Ensifer oleiphilus]